MITKVIVIHNSSVKIHSFAIDYYLTISKILGENQMFRLQRRSSSVIPSLKFIQFFAIHHYSTIAIIISKILEESRGFQLQRQSSSAINNNFKNFMRKPKIPIAKAIVKVQLFAKHQLFNNFKNFTKRLRVAITKTSSTIPSLKFNPSPYTTV